MAALIKGLLSAWAYTMRAAPILLAVLLAIASYFTALRAGIRLWDDSPAGRPDTPDYFVEDFVWLRARKDAGNRTEMTGKLMTHIPANDLLTLRPVNVVRIKAGAPPLAVSAGSAQLNNMSGELLLNDGVTVRRSESQRATGFEMRAPRMMLHTDTETLHAYEDVTLRRAGQELRSATLTINNLTGEVTAQRHVVLSLPPPNKQDSR